jgi:hypothetical protein
VTDQPPDRVGQVGGLVKIVQSLTLTQVLVIALLVMIAIPTYIAWRVINDESMLTKFTSRYEELSSDKMPCTLRVASVRGGGDTYSISTGFAFQGSDRWTVGVIMNSKPDDSELVSYCATLNVLVDHLRRPGAPEPTFPGTQEPMILHYPPVEQP